MKKILIAAGIVLTAGIASAFTFAPATAPFVTENWYEYRGASNSPQELANEQNYFLVSAPLGCSDNQNICSVKVPGTGEHPDAFTSAIQDDILDAVANQRPISGYIEMKD